MNEHYAVLDLGSNSFRLLVVRRRGEDLQVVERVKEKVQLLRDYRDGQLDPAAIERGIRCLERYAERLTSLPRQGIAMLGTQALRQGANRALLAAAAERIIGVPLRIVSGEEEAELVYAGVSMQEPPAAGRSRLVVDIGGGSTEFAWGDASGLREVQSCALGCVSLADRFFRAPGLPARQLSAGQPVPAAGTAVPPPMASAFADTFLAARTYLDTALPALPTAPANLEVVGTSGTVESVRNVLVANGWSDRDITAEGLTALVRALCSGRWDPEAGLLGLAPERVDIFPAGVALLDALFTRLDIHSMRFVDAALEDGAMRELLGLSMPPEQVRQRVVAGLQARFAVDVEQARRVRTAALAFYDQAADWFAEDASAPGSTPPVGGRDGRQLLALAADLHEIGLAVAPRSYHRHGAYLLRHADLRGFSRQEQDCLALLVRGHRRGIPLLAFSALPAGERRVVVRLLVLLRLAVILSRSHADTATPLPEPALDLEPGRDRLVLAISSAWLAAHPLSHRELLHERDHLAATGIELELLLR